jgi:DNA-binding transcriptional LysR family regulator
MDAKDLVAEKIVEEPFVVAVSKDHPLAARTRISFKSLDGVPIVIWPRYLAPDLYDELVRYFKIAGARFNSALETFPLNSLICAVAAGVGVTFVPDCARDNPQKGVVFRSLRPPRPTVKWGIVYKQKNLGGAQEAFLKVVRDVFQVPG